MVTHRELHADMEKRKSFTIQGSKLIFSRHNLLERIQRKLRHEYVTTAMVYERGRSRKGRGQVGWYIYVGYTSPDHPFLEHGPYTREDLLGLARHLNVFKNWERAKDLHVVMDSGEIFPELTLPMHLRFPTLTKKAAGLQRALGLVPTPIVHPEQLHGWQSVTAPVTAPETSGSGKDAPNSDVAHTPVHVTVSAPQEPSPEVPMVRRIGVPDAPMTEKELWELRVADLEMDWLLEPEEVEGSYYTDPATGKRVYWDYSDDPRLTEAEKAKMDNVA